MADYSVCVLRHGGDDDVVFLVVVVVGLFLCVNRPGKKKLEGFSGVGARVCEKVHFHSTMPTLQHWRFSDEQQRMVEMHLVEF